MSKIRIPAGYKPALDLYQTQTAIGTAKRLFEDHLSAALNLRRVSAPLFVDPATGLNDRFPSTSPRPAGRRRWSIRWPNGSAWLCINTVSSPARGCIPI